MQHLESALTLMPFFPSAPARRAAASEMRPRALTRSAEDLRAKRVRARPTRAWTNAIVHALRSKCAQRTCGEESGTPKWRR